MDAMKDMPDKAFDLAIVDPPYGHGSIFEKYRITRTGGSWSKKYQKGKNIVNWDYAPSEEYFIELFRVSRNQIIWGGNYFVLPANRCFLVWEKLTISEAFSMSMCEYAWTSFNDNAKIFKYAPQDPNRFHPTQKPVKLYEWLLGRYAKKGDTILDTHLGSGSIAIACYNLGFDLTGYELDKDYYDSACKRFEEHKKQQRLFE